MTDDYIHLRHEGTQGAPLLFVFHGTGGDERQLFGAGRQLMPEATVVSPRGDVSEGGAARFFRRTAEGVYDMEDLARGTKKLAAFVKAQAFAAGNPPLLGLGYSNGANILASVMFAEPSLFAGAVLMHPLIPFEPRIEGDLSGARILITAGRRDPICPPQLTTRLEAWLAEAGATVETVWHEGGHDVRPTEMEAARQFLSQWSSS
jgi:phospholipase/carboxylesterase